MINSAGYKREMQAAHDAVCVAAAGAALPGPLHHYTGRSDSLTVLLLSSCYF